LPCLNNSADAYEKLVDPIAVVPCFMEEKMAVYWDGYRSFCKILMVFRMTATGAMALGDLVIHAFK